MQTTEVPDAVEIVQIMQNLQMGLNDQALFTQE